MLPKVVIVPGDGVDRQVQLRLCSPQDASQLAASWAPVLERGPSTWLDRGWRWEELDAATELAFQDGPEWVVIADCVEADAPGDLLGVLVTSGPIAAQAAGLDVTMVGTDGLVWVEYIAIAPGLRPGCPPLDQR